MRHATRRRMGGWGLAICALLLAAPEAVAQGATERKVVLAAAEVLGPIVTAEGVLEACDRRDPAGRATRRAALEAWRSSQPLGSFEEALRAMPALQSLRQSLARSTQDKLETLVAKQPALCSNAGSFLASPGMQLAGKIAAFRRLTAAPKGVAPGYASPPEPPAPGLRLHTLAQISALVSNAMDTAGAKPSTRDRALSDARSKAGEVALGRLGPIAIKGRVIGSDRLREWRGERQSTFEIRCRSFAADADRDRMKASNGTDLLVSGAVRSVSEDRTGLEGRIALKACRVLPADAPTLDQATLTEEGGLMPRPMEPEEAFAGAGKGIDPGSVDSVLYEASFSNRMDGFGNGYLDRQEDIYVLLKDGSAYLHTWSFPFTDLDVAQSKRREPARWFTWKSGWLSSGITLTSSLGEAKTLEKPQRLKPLKTGSTFAHAYYYLTVAFGGVRRDRGVTFRADGTMTATRSSFVAASTGYGGGNVGVSGPGFSYSGGGGGQGFIAAQGPSGEITGRYAIAPWSLTITATDGSIERRFFAHLDSETGTPPDSVIVDGEVYWTRKPKD